MTGTVARVATKEHLIHRLEADMRYGRLRADMDPEDVGSARAAKAIGAIIRYVNDLSEDDIRLVRLAEALVVADDSPEVEETVGALQVGLRDGPPSDPGPWLDTYVAAYSGEAESRRRQLFLWG